jgi:hypothetical protein
MTQEEIRRLLGGYALNTLTEGERAALFEAALDDQDLFNALQNEDALRELLSDPVSRAQIRQALDTAANKRSWFWTPQRWLMGAAGLAVAASVAIGLVVWQRPPARKPEALQIAANQVAQDRLESKAEAPLAEPPRDAPRAERQLKSAPAPPGVARQNTQQTSTARDEAQSAQLQGQPAPLAEPVPPPAIANGTIGGAPPALAPAPVAPARSALAAEKRELDASVAATAQLYTGPLVRYSLLRSGTTGSQVKLQVVSQIAAALSLYRLDAQGQWRHVYPVNTPEISVPANTTLQIPDEPIAINGPQDKLRLVVQPAATLAFGSLETGSRLTGQSAEPRAKALAKKTAAPAPLVIEITIPLSVQ